MRVLWLCAVESLGGKSDLFIDMRVLWPTFNVKNLGEQQQKVICQVNDLTEY